MEISQLGGLAMEVSVGFLPELIATSVGIGVVLKRQHVILGSF